MNVYVVWDENGAYSDYRMAVIGVYASLEAAKASLQPEIDIGFERLRAALAVGNYVPQSWWHGPRAVDQQVTGAADGFHWTPNGDEPPGLYHYEPYSATTTWTITAFEVQGQHPV